MSRRNPFELTAAQAAELLATGAAVWLLDGRGTGDVGLYHGSEGSVRAALLDETGLDEWPECWSLRRVGAEHPKAAALLALDRELQAAQRAEWREQLHLLAVERDEALLEIARLTDRLSAYASTVSLLTERLEQLSCLEAA